MRASGAVVWFTGLPASGKTTLARAVQAELVAARCPVCLFDSDEVRAALRPAPGYDAAGRDDFYVTLGNLAVLLAGQGIVVLVAATAHRRVWRDRVRRLAPRFVEVFVSTGAAECEARDPKHLYAAARAGRVRGLPGAGAEYEVPAAAEVVAAGGLDAEALTRIAQLVHPRADGESRPGR